ncbi:cytochrome P450 [Phanerochaete sordida]|uniref:Cytochrome P450 n=1 Tax=Phanerochaete sordida TaxID=48140 RepID=A0A9P3GSX9_9APHY|nr:cytochrome P450 [Phanerochaete sordida]
MSALSTSALFAAVSILFLAFIFLRRARHRYPPGPQGWPLIGNLFNAPTSFEWLVYLEWSRKYNSDIVHFEVLGTHYVVLNSAKAAADLFERRSHIYSDKPGAPMIEMTGLDKNIGLMKYSDHWRANRRLFHQYFRSTVVSTYHPLTARAVRELIYALSKEPSQFEKHIRKMAGANILRIIYGMEVESEDDSYMVVIDDVLHAISTVASSRAYLVDSFPILRHVPAWFPGAKFKREIAKWRVSVEEMYMRPFRELKVAFESGHAKPCVLTNMLFDISQDKEGRDPAMLEQVAINTAGTAYSAAADTITLALINFILAMLMHPEVQERAQEEIVSILGPDKLPEMEDQDSLPFITAVMKESLRWRPPLPLAVPHRAVVDDEYNGYHIPAGSVVIGNGWAIMHDNSRYPDPESFNPARFLDHEGKLRKDVPDPMQAFGYGRRICPGRYFVFDTLWMTEANILAVFSIQKPQDELGNAVEPGGEYTSGTFSFPTPFEARFQRRDGAGSLS